MVQYQYLYSVCCTVLVQYPCYLTRYCTCNCTSRELQPRRRNEVSSAWHACLAFCSPSFKYKNMYSYLNLYCTCTSTVRVLVLPFKKSFRFTKLRHSHISRHVYNCYLYKYLNYLYKCDPMRMGHRQGHRTSDTPPHRSGPKRASAKKEISIIGTHKYSTVQ